MPGPVPVGTRRLKPHGYVMVKVAPGYRQWRYEHRVVWEAAHGPIPKGYAVHHINEDRADNRLENLELCESNADHFRRFHGDRSAENGRRGAAKTRGVPKSPEWKAKMSAIRSGQRYPTLSAALKGKPKSPEHREKLRLAALARHARERANRKAG